MAAYQRDHRVTTRPSKLVRVKEVHSGPTPGRKRLVLECGCTVVDFASRVDVKQRHCPNHPTWSVVNWFTAGVERAAGLPASFLNPPVRLNELAMTPEWKSANSHLDADIARMQKMLDKKR